jgi:hypothetical protein
MFFNLFIGDLPNCLPNCPESVSLCTDRIDCLLYADDVIIFSNSANGLQDHLNALVSYCDTWCLNVNLKQTKVLIFNKSGRHIKEPFYFKNELIEFANKCKYLGAIFQSSGLSNYAKEELYNKSLKASCTLSRCLSGSAASIKANLHLFDHTIKPIVLYGSEIWGMFKTNSVACKKNAINISEKKYQNNVADKINLKFCKFTLGVNSKSSNIAVLSEIGRFPIYFNIVLSMISYLHQLHHCSSNLLKEAFLYNKNLHENNIQTWYSSVIFLLDKLDLKKNYCRGYSINKRKEIVIKKLKTLFLKAWFHEKDNVSGKLDACFFYKSVY